MQPIHPTIKGRGAATNPTGRFEVFSFDVDGDVEPDPHGEESSIQTQFFRDSSKTIIARNDSPDIPFAQSINPYRGCEHGCVYC